MACGGPDTRPTIYGTAAGNGRLECWTAAAASEFVILAVAAGRLLARNLGESRKTRARNRCVARAMHSRGCVAPRQFANPFQRKRARQMDRAYSESRALLERVLRRARVLRDFGILDCGLVDQAVGHAEEDRAAAVLPAAICAHRAVPGRAAGDFE